jgi:medium-chain acyl-[acyl-carrier-protein] hydrolase
VVFIKQKFISNSLVSINPIDNAPFRLFCFPHAGGSSSFFNSWLAHVPKDIELIALQLPGRERRINETPLDSIEEIVGMLSSEISLLLDKPYAFFGHSMGSIVSYEVCKYLVNANNPTPNHLYLSSCRAPHIPCNEKLHNLPHDEFIEELKELNGTPKEILENQSFRDIYLPTIISDFKIVESYYRSVPFLLPVPITCFIGDNDVVNLNDLLEWKHYTNEFSYTIYEGDHFYLNIHKNKILNVIQSNIKYRIVK